MHVLMCVNVAAYMPAQCYTTSTTSNLFTSCLFFSKVFLYTVHFLSFFESFFVDQLDHNIPHPLDHTPSYKSVEMLQESEGPIPPGWLSATHTHSELVCIYTWHWSMLYISVDHTH